ncbi:MAG: hypothetical protein NZ694_00555 [Tepidimonas sp.]|nr:hypothetical protein [Tepidimonas sp.]
MKLLIDNDRIVGLATDDYTGPMQTEPVPGDFDPARMHVYVRRGDGTWHIPPPQSVTMRQARLALLAAGLMDDVEATIDAIPDETQRRAAQIEWEYAQEVQRSSPWVQQLAAGLGLTDEQLDQLFEQASQL